MRDNECRKNKSRLCLAVRRVTNRHVPLPALIIIIITIIIIIVIMSHYAQRRRLGGEEL
jgi:hypothetical protein